MTPTLQIQNALKRLERARGYLELALRFKSESRENGALSIKYQQEGGIYKGWAHRFRHKSNIKRALHEWVMNEVNQ